MSKLKKLFPSPRLVNLYGPTEATIYCAIHEVGDVDPTRPVPIGVPFDTTDVAVVDDSGKEAATGEFGELVLTGGQISPGYYKRPEMSEKVFRKVAGRDAYLTGDIARQHADGTLHLQGRKDDMFKSRGYRIERNDIELCLNPLRDRVDDFAIVTVPDELSENLIYLVVSGSRKSLPTNGEIRKLTRKLLPKYMAPAEVVYREKMLNLTSGKIDRNGLRAELKKNVGNS